MAPVAPPAQRRRGSAVNPFTPRLELRLVSDPAAVGRARHAVEEFARRCGLDEQACQDLGLCLNEAMSNIIRHAYNGATDRPIEISAENQPEHFRLRLRDWGNARTPPLQASADHDPMTPGGLGMICLCRLMDEVKFEPQPDGMVLHLVRRKSNGSPAMSQQPCSLIHSSRLVGATLVVAIEGEIDLNNSPDLRRALFALVEQHKPTTVVLNLAGVPYMDSSGVAVLVELLRKLGKAPGRICLAHLQARVRGLLEIARLNTIFTLADDEPSALASITGAPRPSGAP